MEGSSNASSLVRPSVTAHYEILLVDDEEDVRTLLCDILQRRGFAIESVSSAAACLRQLRIHDVSIVVTDIEMPGMSGIELCERLRDRHPDVIVVVVSGRTDEATMTAARASGAFRIMRKPVESKAIDRVLREAINTLERRN